MLLKIRTKFAESFFSQRRPLVMSSIVAIWYIYIPNFTNLVYFLRLVVHFFCLVYVLKFGIFFSI